MAHDAETAEQLWWRRLVLAPAEPGNETDGDVPYENGILLGYRSPLSVDLDLNLVFVCTSVNSPDRKFLRSGIENTHPYHNPTIPLAAEHRD